MAARLPSRSLFLPDICVTRFHHLLTSRPRVSGQLLFARVLRVNHPVQE